MSQANERKLLTGGTRRIEGPDIQRPHRTFPPVSELKIATVSRIVSQEEDEPAAPGMYVLVPTYFPSECKVVHGTVGYYAGCVLESGGAEYFYVRPAPTVARAHELYEELTAGEPLPDFMICLRRLPRPDDIERFVEKHSHPPELVTCCCGAQTTIRYYSTPTERFLPDDRSWVFRKMSDRDTHLPGAWYCGRAGHYMDIVMIEEDASSSPQTVGLRTELLTSEGPE